MDSRGFVVAVDGPSGAGKSTASRALARRLGFRYVDTGAMYRGVAYLASEQGIGPHDGDRLAELARRLRFEFLERPDGSARVLASGRDITREIRRPEVGRLASAVSAEPALRECLLMVQRAMAEGVDVVMEGRDIGTVVFPDAPVKFFITAAPATRAKRRSLELKESGQAAEADMARVEAEQAERDARDTLRTHAPLRQASDSLVLDTTDMTLEAVIDAMDRAVAKRRRG